MSFRVVIFVMLQNGLRRRLAVRQMHTNANAYDKLEKFSL